MAVWLIVQVGAIAASGARLRVSAVAPIDAESWALAQLFVVQAVLATLVGPLVIRRWRDLLATAATYPPMWAIAVLLAGEDIARWGIGATVVMSWHVGAIGVAMHVGRWRAWVACIGALLSIGIPAMVYLATDAGRDLPRAVLHPISPTLSAIHGNPAGLILPMGLVVAAAMLQFRRARAKR